MKKTLALRMDTNNIKQYMNTTEDRFFELMFTSYLSDFQVNFNGVKWKTLR